MLKISYESKYFLYLRSVHQLHDIKELYPQLIQFPDYRYIEHLVIKKKKLTYKK